MISNVLEEIGGGGEEGKNELLKKSKKIQIWKLYCSHTNYYTICHQAVIQ